MKIYYLLDKNKQKQYNSRGLDYTPLYLSAMAAYMGIDSNPIEKHQLSLLCSEDILLVGAEKLDTLPDCRIILMGGGIGREAEPAKRERKIFGRYLLGDKQLPIFAPIHTPCLENAEILAYARTDAGLVPALVKRGEVYEFCFDLAASVWFSGDGFFPEETPGYFYILRTPDMRPLPDGDEAHGYAYNDLLLTEVEGILRSFGVAAAYRLLPKEDGTAPDAMLHFSGDDDCSGEQINVSAALTMESFGFPYHINAMIIPSVGFIFGKESYDLITSHGCEIALHTNFIGSSYEAKTVAHQCKRFEQTFGVHPYTNTNHCLIQGGSNADRLRWFSDVGIMADNGKLAEFDKTDINKFGLVGFGFGTSFPRFSLDDAEHENRALSTIEIPINYYEPRLYTEESSTDDITNYIDGGVANGRIMQFFIHPHYICEGGKDREATLRSLRVIKNHIASSSYDVLLTTTNTITKFWHARAKSTIRKDGNTIKTICESPMLLRLPEEPKRTPLVDSEAGTLSEKVVCQEKAYLLYIPAGEHTVEL